MATHLQTRPTSAQSVVLEIPPAASPSTEILLHHTAHNHNRVLIVFLNSSPASLTPQANIALASSLAYLGRSSGAVHHLVQLADSSALVLDRKLYLYALYRCLEENGQRNPAFAHEVEKGILQHNALVFVPRLDGYFFGPSRALSLYQQVVQYEEAGGMIAPTSFAAAVKRDWVNGTHLKFLGTDPSTILEAVDEFGPWHEVLLSMSAQFSRNKTLMNKLVQGSSNELPRGQGLLELARMASFRAATAISNFLQGDYIVAFDWTSRYFAVADEARRFIFPDGIRALTTRDILTMAMLITNCLERGVVLDVSTIERIYTRLANPEAELHDDETETWRMRRPGSRESAASDFFQCSLSWSERQLGEENLLLNKEVMKQSLMQPMRKSQYFLCCGHLRRHMAALGASERKITLLSGESIKARAYSARDCALAARLYIIAAACHPLDDPQLYRLYDRAVWALCMSGGIHARALWLFLHSRHRASFTANFTPAIWRLPSTKKSSSWSKAKLKRRPRSESSALRAPNYIPSVQSRASTLHQDKTEGTSLKRPQTVADLQALNSEPDTKVANGPEIMFSGADLSDWPHFENQRQALYQMQMFVESIHEAVEDNPDGLNFDQTDVTFLSPLVLEHQIDGDHPVLYLAGEYLPNRADYNQESGIFVSPEIKSQIKLLQFAVAEQVALSKELVNAWAAAYTQINGSTPDWTAEVLEWSGYVSSKAL